MKLRAATLAHALQPSAEPGAHVRSVERLPRRVLFVDLLRFFAAFQMLQGHTIAALLATDYRVGKWYAVWSVARGLTSVAFLFAAGLSFYIVTAGEYAKARAARAGARKRLRRAFTLIALGYLLHLPLAAAVSTDVNAVQAAFRGFVAVDVLQCIGVCLLILQALSSLTGSLRALTWASACLGAACFALTPLVAQLPASALPAWLLGYISPASGSLFPLLPWAGHVFGGVAVAALVVPEANSAEPAARGASGVLRELPRAASPETRSALHLVAVAAALLAVAHWLAASHAYASVADQLGRLGKVALLCAGIAFAVRRQQRLPNWVVTLSAETLFLYAFHVLLVYGTGVGLADRVGPQLEPLAALLAALGVVLASAAAALGYRRLRVARGVALRAGNRLAAAGRTR